LTFDPTEEAAESANDLRPNPAVLLVVVAAIGAISALSLPWQVAIASTALGALMIAGADIDARTFLLPDWITGGAFGCGVVAAALLQLDETSPLISAGDAILRALCVAVVLALFRYGYARIRRREGLGLGDVKLAAAIGAWLPIQAIPLCFGIATSGALLIVLIALLKGEPVSRATRIPFGAFLCPALWIVFYADKVMR
jgi:leader peptidase (prepilin peptidase)/N-methyltransferase